MTGGQFLSSPYKWLNGKRTRDLSTQQPKMKRAIKTILKSTWAGRQILNSREFCKRLYNSAIIYNELKPKERAAIAPYILFSKSQNAQDLFALAFTDTRFPQFFVEFGATDGVTHSNTWILEKKLGWKGILAEPAKIWHSRLKANRACTVDTNCVAGESGRIAKFVEVTFEDGEATGLSTIKEFAENGDWASDIRTSTSTSKEYETPTISLDDLLEKYNAPNYIQFLSIDTEGSELEILEGHDFSRRKIGTICVEHNYMEKNRKAINSLLLKNGYVQVLQRVSKYDDWYLLKQD